MRSIGPRVLASNAWSLRCRQVVEMVVVGGILRFLDAGYVGLPRADKRQLSLWGPMSFEALLIGLVLLTRSSHVFLLVGNIVVFDKCKVISNVLQRYHGKLGVFFFEWLLQLDIVASKRPSSKVYFINRILYLLNASALHK